MNIPTIDLVQTGANIAKLRKAAAYPTPATARC